MEPGKEARNPGPPELNSPAAGNPASGNRTSANIGLSLSAASLETAPGQSVETTIRVRNRSLIVDRYRITVEGLDPTWWTLSMPTFTGFPNDEGESKLTIHPPKEAGAMAGNYSFRVAATSESNPQEETIMTARLVLKGFVNWEVEISPAKVTGERGTYLISANNAGNADAVLLFEGKDPEEGLIFDFSRNKVIVPAAGTSQIKLTVYPKKGQDRKLYHFQVTSTRVGQSGDTKLFYGQLEYAARRRFPWWLAPAVPGVAGVLLILLGIAAGSYESTATESHLFGLYYTSTTSTPFQSYMLPLIIGGAVLIIAGIVIGLRSKK